MPVRTVRQERDDLSPVNIRKNTFAQFFLCGGFLGRVLSPIPFSIFIGEVISLLTYSFHLYCSSCVRLYALYFPTVFRYRPLIKKKINTLQRPFTSALSEKYFRCQVLRISQQLHIENQNIFSDLNLFILCSLNILFGYSNFSCSLQVPWSHG